MAIVKVKDICPICKEKIDPGLAIYITKADLTPEARGTEGTYRYKPTPEGKLRIKYLGSSKPRTCIHQKCYEEKIEALLK